MSERVLHKDEHGMTRDQDGYFVYTGLSPLHEDADISQEGEEEEPLEG